MVSVGITQNTGLTLSNSGKYGSGLLVFLNSNVTDETYFALIEGDIKLDTFLDENPTYVCAVNVDRVQEKFNTKLKLSMISRACSGDTSNQFYASATIALNHALGDLKLFQNTKWFRPKYVHVAHNVQNSRYSYQGLDPTTAQYAAYMKVDFLEDTNLIYTDSRARAIDISNFHLHQGTSSIYSASRTTGGITYSFMDILEFDYSSPITIDTIVSYAHDSETICGPNTVKYKLYSLQGSTWVEVKTISVNVDSFIHVSTDRVTASKFRLGVYYYGYSYDNKANIHPRLHTDIKLDVFLLGDSTQEGTPNELSYTPTRCLYVPYVESSVAFRDPSLKIPKSVPIIGLKVGQGEDIQLIDYNLNTNSPPYIEDSTLTLK